jgi:hypothetical protein
VTDGTAPKTLSVPEAGKIYFDLGKNASYEAVKRGEIPSIKIGSRLRVPIAALERMLSDARTSQAFTNSSSIPEQIATSRQKPPKTSRLL